MCLICLSHSFAISGGQLFGHSLGTGPNISLIDWCCELSSHYSDAVTTATELSVALCWALLLAALLPFTAYAAKTTLMLIYSICLTKKVSLFSKMLQDYLTILQMKWRFAFTWFCMPLVAYEQMHLALHKLFKYDQIVYMHPMHYYVRWLLYDGLATPIFQCLSSLSYS